MNARAGGAAWDWAAWDRRGVLGLLLATVLAAPLPMAPARATESPAAAYRLSAPIVHENLAIFLVRGGSTPGPVPLTLQEAMAQNLVRVHETGNVNELTIENLGDQEIFVQSGDIVKGGKQDRALTASLVLPPRSGKVALASFCVEQGRWAARGREDVSAFSAADAAVPSRAAKLAMKAPGAAAPVPGRGDRSQRGRSESMRGASELGVRQQQVWRSVAETQQKLAGSIGAPVAAVQSQSSLQLALENERLKQRQAAFVDAFRAAGEKDGDVIGYVFAINGKINSADIYPANGLFRKMWPKLLDASVTEAIGEKGEAGTPPSTETVLAFLQAAETGTATQQALNKDVRLETRDGGAALYFATERTAGGWVHRNYLAKN